MHILKIFWGILFLGICTFGIAAETQTDSSLQAVKTFLPSVPSSEQLGINLLSDHFSPYEAGYTETDGLFWCDNEGDFSAARGTVQTVQLAQTKPIPLYVSGESLAENVEGGADSNYSIYVDLIYTDGTSKWGEFVNFSTGSHDWEKKGFYIFPAKPIQHLFFYTLFRFHSGKAAFRNLALQELQEDANKDLFDTFRLDSMVPLEEGKLTFQLRDVSDDTPFYRVGDETEADGRLFSACGVDCTFQREERPEGYFYRAQLTSSGSEDKILTFLVSYPFRREQMYWLENGIKAEEYVPIESGCEYFSGSSWISAGTNGRLSRWPFAAVAAGSDGKEGVMLGLDPDYPAFYRIFYNEPAGELVLAYDLALTQENPTAELKFFTAPFAAQDGFAGALSAYYRFYPDHFLRRISSQGNWMPFAKISAVPDWEDFGFKFKEGDKEAEWDDEHGIYTFRYTEPMTWWMMLEKDEPRTIKFGVEKAKQLAENGNEAAQAFLTSGHKDLSGQFCGKILDTPWCNGIVWSLNDLPGLAETVQNGTIPYSDIYPVSGFGVKWNQTIADAQYGKPGFFSANKDSGPVSGLDGEYIDSSEGYVTEVCDYDRNHFSAACRPLIFDRQKNPAVFVGLVAYEYAHTMAEDVHRRGHLMMANATPYDLFWIVPSIDVAGTETNWNRDGNWSPMTLDDLYYRRGLMGKKPFCFLMNTDFTKFSYEMTEKYMNRALAFGMFPGFFSADASTGHYFENPDLFERDRPLFQKYMPIIREVAEAGWEPLTLAHADDNRLNLSRFGDGGTVYLTVYNPENEPLPAQIRLDSSLLEKWGKKPLLLDQLTGEEILLDDGVFSITLDSEKTAVLKITERK